jgi:hypothetical protein
MSYVRLKGDVSQSSSTPSDITVTALQGNSVKSGALSSAQDGYVLTWVNSDGKWEAEPVTSSLSELCIVGGYQTWGQSTFNLTGARVLDVRPFSVNKEGKALQATFYATIYKTAGATSVEVRLYDVTQSVTVTGSDMTGTSSSPVELSASLTVGSASGNLRDDIADMYEVDIKMNGGVVGTDAVFIANARVVLNYA